MERDHPPTAILQVKDRVTVYLLFVDDTEGVNGRRNDRDVLMIREGIKQHPFVEMIGEGPGETEKEIEAASKADFILYPMWGDMREEVCDMREEVCNRFCPALIAKHRVPKKRLAVMDFSDGAMKLPWTPPSMAHIIFKRSLVSKYDGSFKDVSNGCGYNSPQPCFPLDYAVRPDNYKGLKAATLSQNRKYSIVYLCQHYGGMSEGLIGQISSARLRVKQWLHLMQSELPDTAFIGYSDNPKDKFRHADIVVVADPGSYEGQHAIYESLGNGAVVLVNNRWVPMPFPLEDGKHVHYFDVCDTDDARRAFQEKVKHLLSQSAEEKTEFRLRAWEHALQYHQAANRVDYIVATMLEWRGKLPVVPKSLRVHPGEKMVSDLRDRCVKPVEKLRQSGVWLDKNPFLRGGRQPWESKDARR